MSNTEKSKNLILEAIRNLSDDFALSDARSLLSKALNEIQHIESKRSRRDIESKRRESISEAARASKVISNAPVPWTPNQIATTMSFIDKMIAEEKQKLENMKKVQTQQKITNDFDGLLNG